MRLPAGPHTGITTAALGMAHERCALPARPGARVARAARIALAAVACAAIPAGAHGQGVDQPSPAAPLGALSLSGSHAAGGQDFPWGPAPPGDAHPARDRGYSLRHQELRVRFDEQHERVSGTTSLEIVAGDAPVSAIGIDAMNMTIATVLDARGTALTYQYDQRTIDVALATPLAPRASVTISIEYSVERPRAGVFFVAAPRVVWTQGMLRNTRYWVPTIDDVDSRPTWTVDVRCPIGEQAVATGHLDMSGTAAGQAIWRWVESDPTPIRYLTIAVGPYVRVSGAATDSVRQPPLTLWALRDARDSARVGFATAAQTLVALERLLGPPGRHGVVNLFVVPQFPFWTQLDDWRPVVTTPALDDRFIVDHEHGWPGESAEMTVARRLAQEWFGMSIAPKHWSDMWLAEGFGNFMAQVVYASAHGDGSVDAIRNWSHVSTFGADRDHRRPLVYDRWLYGPIELLDTEHAGQKGAVVLRMLQSELGDSVFWTGMRHFVSRYAGRAAATDDFQHVLEEVSRRDLSTFFRQWVYGAGYPFLSITTEYDTVRRQLVLTVRQVQRRDSLTGFFDAPVAVEIGTRDGPRTVTVPMRGDVSTFRAELTAPPTYVDWDPDGVLQSDVTFQRSTPLLVGQLEHDPHARSRIEAAQRLVARARGTGGATGIFLDASGSAPTIPLADSSAMGPVVRAARSDSSAQVRAGIAEALAGAFDAPSRAALMEATHDPAPAVRASAALALFGVPGAEARARLSELATSDPDEGVRETAKQSQEMGASPGGQSTAFEESVLDTAGERSKLAILWHADQTPNGWAIGRRLLTDSGSSRAVKQAAMRQLAIAVSMQQWNPGASREEFVKLAEPLLASDDPSTRLAAARDLSVVNGPAAIAALEARKAVEVDALVLTEIDRSLARATHSDNDRP